MVQNRCLLPESPLRRNSQNGRVLLHKYFWVIGCGIGLDPSDFCGRPSGQRTDLQTNNLQGSGICKQVRIGKDNCLFVLFVYVNIRLTAKLLRKFCPNGGTKLLRKKNLCPSIGFFVERILFGVGTFFPWLVLTVSQHPPIQNQINIFGKAADQIECLGKTGAAFEGNSLFPRAAVEQIIQRKAYPKIFFYDGIIQAHFIGGISEQFAPVTFRQSCYIPHCVSPPHIFRIVS